MADISVQQKKGGDLTGVWAAAAIVAVVALMAWLFTTQPPATQVVTGGDTSGGRAVGEPVDLTALGSAQETYLGREVIVSDVPVSVVLGSRSFWAEVPGGNPLLVIVGVGVSDVSWVTPGVTATLYGTVQSVTEAEIDRLVQAQALHPDARSQALFATHYLLVAEAER